VAAYGLLSRVALHNLDLASVPQWANIQNYWTPASVDTNCPYCAKLVNFTPTYQNYDPHRKTMACSATCPACFKAVYLWVVHPRAASDQTKRPAAVAEIAGLKMFTTSLTGMLGNAYLVWDESSRQAAVFEPVDGIWAVPASGRTRPGWRRRGVFLEIAPVALRACDPGRAACPNPRPYPVVNAVINSRHDG